MGESMKRGTQGLFLFLVAEKPTIGIDGIQWNNALGWVGQHSNQETLRGALRVLGPTFSGSVPSVARALVDVGKQKHFTCRIRNAIPLFAIVTGHASHFHEGQYGTIQFRRS
jgi:hypothetical protein